MKISVIGSGYVGLVTSACLASCGNSVLCIDIDKQKIDALNSGFVPIYEPGLEELIRLNVAAGRLKFTTDIEKSVNHGQIQFIAVGTPADQDGSADLRYVLEAAKSIATHMTEFKVIVNKSTVPIGTADQVRDAIGAIIKTRNISIDFAVVSNPEFLKEGAAIDDFMRPDRIVIGVYDDESGVVSEKLMRNLYAPFNRNHDRLYKMDVRSAELTKYAANAMLATRISFMNELANLADKVGADIECVRHGIGSDSRIGYNFLYAGAGYGGSCFPKDISALLKTATKQGIDLKILGSVHEANETQKLVLTNKIVARFGEDLSGKVVALWGLAFKPNTDDMRDAPSRVLIKTLIERGAKIQAHDPVAMSVARAAILNDFNGDTKTASNITFCESPEVALKNADFLVVLTEWKDYRSPDFSALCEALHSKVIFDGRNIYGIEDMEKFGIEYYGIGRGSR